MIDEKVRKYSEELRRLGIEHKIVEHPQLKTADEVQNYLGLTLADGFSTLIMQADGEIICVIRRDDCRLDMEKLKKILSVKDLRMISDEEFTVLTGLEPGAAKAYIAGKKTYLDGKLFEKEYLTGGSGSFTSSIRYKSEDLKKIPGSGVVEITTLKEENISTTFSVKGKKRILSGITPSGNGKLHIGNYLGAIRQFNEMAKNHECFLFVADLHALTTIQNRQGLINNVETQILHELALFENLDNIVFFRQSDVPMHTELQSILNNVTSLGLIKRAHAYKDKLQKQTEEDDINMGLFSYPMLMAADILIYKPDYVPVGKDQKQHIEIARDIAVGFNKVYQKKVFLLPEPYIPEKVAVILGPDGKRKMSKSLGNVISIFEDEETIRKQVMSTYTDPARIHSTDSGHIEGNMVFSYLDFFGEKERVEELKKLYQAGKIADVEVKNYLLASLLEFFKPARERYQELLANPEKVKKILKEGAERARTVASQTMEEVREAIGLTNRYSL